MSQLASPRRVPIPLLVKDGKPVGHSQSQSHSQYSSGAGYTPSFFDMTYYQNPCSNPQLLNFSQCANSLSTPSAMMSTSAGYPTSSLQGTSGYSHALLHSTASNPLAFSSDAMNTNSHMSPNITHNMGTNPIQMFNAALDGIDHSALSIQGQGASNCSALPNSSFHLSQS